MQRYVIGNGEFVKVDYFTSDCQWVGAFEFYKMEAPLAFFESAWYGAQAGYELDETSARVFTWLAWIKENENSLTPTVTLEGGLVTSHNLPMPITVNDYDCDGAGENVKKDNSGHEFVEYLVN